VQYCVVRVRKTIYYLAAKGASKTRPMPRPGHLDAKAPKARTLQGQGHIILSSRCPRGVLEDEDCPRRPHPVLFRATISKN